MPMASRSRRGKDFIAGGLRFKAFNFAILGKTCENLPEPDPLTYRFLSTIGSPERDHSPPSPGSIDSCQSYNVYFNGRMPSRQGFHKIADPDWSKDLIEKN